MGRGFVDVLRNALLGEGDERVAGAEKTPMLSGSKRYKDQLDDVANDRDTREPDNDPDDVNTPGSKAYLERRDKQAAEDLSRTRK